MKLLMKETLAPAPKFDQSRLLFGLLLSLAMRPNPKNSSRPEARRTRLASETVVAHIAELKVPQPRPSGWAQPACVPVPTCSSSRCNAGATGRPTIGNCLRLTSPGGEGPDYPRWGPPGCSTGSSRPRSSTLDSSDSSGSGGSGGNHQQQQQQIQPDTATCRQ